MNPTPFASIPSHPVQPSSGSYSLVRRLRRAWIPVALTLLAAAVLFLPLPLPRPAPAARFYRVEASSFQFIPSVLRVNPGDTVTIELVSSDYVHGLAIDGYGLEVIADPGQTARLSFTANRPGTFRFRCPVACGPMHPFMIGKLAVGPNLLFYRGAGLALLAVVAGIWHFSKETAA